MGEPSTMKTISWILVLQCALIVTTLQHEYCSAACPPPPVQCAAKARSCYLTNYRGEWEDQNPCKAATAFFPKNESELIHAVAYAVKEEKKIKVITGGAHSLNRFACPGGNSGVVISTRDYNSRIEIDVKSMTVTVDAGVGLRKLLDTLAAKELALPQSTEWDGLSLAGVISTAAHGSGLTGKGGGIHDHVVGMSIVVPVPAEQGYAKLIHLTEKDEEIKAARVSLGVLGAISQVTFAVEKMFKRSISLKLKADSDLESKFVKFAESHEFGEIRWYPSLSRVLYFIQDRVSVDAKGKGKRSEIPFRPATVQSVVQNRVTEELNNAKINASNFCKSVKTQVEQGMKTGNGYLNDGVSFKGFPVVGYNHLMQSSSGCQIDPRSGEQDTCPWKGKDLKSNDTICSWDTQVKGSFFYHTSIAIPMSRIVEAIKDLKQLRDINPTAFCTMDSSLGIQFRYFKKSADYLSHKEDSVVFEFMYMHYREIGKPRWNGHVMDEIEQMLLQKYGGVPHWGKNRVYTFDGAAKRTVNLGKFLKVKELFDPKGYFSSEWSDGVLGVGKAVEIWGDGCALDGLCVLQRRSSLRSGQRIRVPSRESLEECSCLHRSVMLTKFPVMNF
ncbi:hypothetical protein SUGI_0710110 [Cryptomeria japonica]|uniref:L-gulonolactone oxidase 2 n=1 Tax=Cryptomeria japonica TaxID=3369 RepID=UPI002414A40C|nr:L-gulonolactone oxidase 2 [Cryptomeria japonica]GLJ35295.1 hypothetical protein SUGI_0710110 [Cryptomeria japonica]